MGSTDLSKIQHDHLQRLALVYVRQSSLHQVQYNTASTARQYNLVDRAKELGWPAEKIVVIDQDQGQSGGFCRGARWFQDPDERDFDRERRSCIQFGSFSAGSR